MTDATVMGLVIVVRRTYAVSSAYLAETGVSEISVLES